MASPLLDLSDDYMSARLDLVAPMTTALRSHGVVIATGSAVDAVLATARMALESVGADQVWELDGDGHSSGYLAGAESFLLDLLAKAETSHPEVVSRHEQTLKRIWPRRKSAAYRVPRDLTALAERDERTRFYHQEYQSKLIVGLVEFALEAVATTNQRIGIVVKRCDRLPPTTRSLIDAFCRLQPASRLVSFVLVEGSSIGRFAGRTTVHFPGLSKAEFEAALGLEAMRRGHLDLLFDRAGGDVDLAGALLTCVGRGRGLETIRCMTAESVLDMHLASLSYARRLEMAAEYFDRACIGDPIQHRNAQTLPLEALDSLRLQAHEVAMARYRAGTGPLVLAHALAVGDRASRLQALVEPSEVLMSIGLYDTWFEFFSPIFLDPAMRELGSGDDPTNGLFINAAFVLYAMGYAAAALPFLDEFLSRFPASKFVPTALYAQSMTYGRYQVPVDLLRAEACATRNLTLIDEMFPSHPRYTYIKVFAENAYAYIKARQGRFKEALELCETGITEIVDVYGADVFKLHRSILIYNTSQVYELVGDLVQAENRLQAAIECDPYYAEYHNDMGNLLCRIPGRESEALDAYGRAIALSPPYYEAHLNRGQLLVQLGRLEAAVLDFQRALLIKPSEWRALRELGNLHLHVGELAAAVAAYDRALEYEDRDADLHANAALAHSELGDVTLTLRHLNAAVAANPEHAGAHNTWAAELVKLGRIEEALSHARLASEFGDDPDFDDNLATIESLLASGPVGVLRAAVGAAH